MENAVNLAMPFGLPEPEANILNHYQALAEQTTIQTQNNTVQIFTTNAPEWSSVHTMCRCIAEVLPPETTATDGSLLSQVAILIKPWIWDFLQMTESNNSGGLLPSKIVYKNIDEASFRDDVEEEIETNERYAEVEDKETLLNKFINGEVKLLLQSEIKIGAGTLINSGEHSGERGFELQFFDHDDTLIDPAQVSEIFSVVGGRTISDHPFSKYFSLPVWPNISPLEGGIRFKVVARENSFSEETSLTVGRINISANEIRILPEGNILYATMPPGESFGHTDLITHTPGLEEQVYTNSITYRTKVIEAFRSILASLILSLEELKFLVESGVIENINRVLLQEEIKRISHNHLNLLLQRNHGGGGSLRSPEVNYLLNNFESTLSAKYEELFDLIEDT